MSQQKTLEEIVVEQADVVRHQIEEAADFAESEMDLQIEVAKALDHFSGVAHLPKLRAHHNVTIGEGRPDSVYGCVFIEYKTPGQLTEDNKSSGNKDLIKELERRPKEFQKELKRDVTELIGIGTDGRWFIFARYRTGRWEIGQPQPVSTRVVERVLRYLVGLGTAGKPFQPDYLAGDFSAESERKLARDGIATLYARIREVEQRPQDFPKAKVLFDQWRILFGEVCGYDVTKLSPKIKELADFYGVHKNPNPAALLFAVHSYYALFMKFLAAEIATTFNPLSASFLQRLHQTGSSKRLQQELRELEDGGIYRQLGIKNFLEGDLFSWYLDAWDDHVEKVVRDMVACFDEYDAKTLVVEPDETRDLLKKLYQQLFPKTVRHDLGEYYTPDWLAELVMERVGYTGDPDKRVLDPACGSGTFLVMAINKIREYAAAHTVPKHLLLPKILANVVGFDLNPLAVMAARTNYLLALRDMLKLGAAIEIPVYLCDSIMTLAEHGELFTTEGQAATEKLGKLQELKTSAARFMIPTEIAKSREVVSAYTEELERCVRGDYSEHEFIDRLRDAGLPVDSVAQHKALFRQVRKLRVERRNDIWARIIKNSFAPLFIGRADFVLGNPPWVNWESLPEDYRDATKHLWFDFGLFTLSGSAARLGGGKKDLAILFVYAGISRYLAAGGSLGFVVTQTLFKTTGAGDGFRRLQIGKREHFKIAAVDDFSAIQPFEGATNRTAVVHCQLGTNRFPVPYIEWLPKPRERVSQEEALDAVKKKLRPVRKQARPITAAKPTSPWLTTAGGVEELLRGAVGESAYRAYEGCNTGGVNAVLWVETVHAVGKDRLLIRNILEGAKRKVRGVEATIESRLVYPLVRGRDVDRFHAAGRHQIIVTQNPESRSGWGEEWMKRNAPDTYAYLRRFKGAFLERKSSSIRRLMETGPFYSIFGVSEYTLSPFKVVWPEVGHTVSAAVVGSQEMLDGQSKVIIPDHTCVLVPTTTAEEAHFIAALLNSAVAQAIVCNYVVLHPSPHVMRHVAIPRFKPKDALHKTLATLSKQAHQLKAENGGAERIQEVEAEIDQAAVELWGIDARHLENIREAARH
jgi:SAM-dependent methyltransferase